MKTQMPRTKIPFQRRNAKVYMHVTDVDFICFAPWWLKSGWVVPDWIRGSIDLAWLSDVWSLQSLTNLTRFNCCRYTQWRKACQLLLFSELRQKGIDVLASVISWLMQVSRNASWWKCCWWILIFWNATRYLVKLIYYVEWFKLRDFIWA